jgi:hypothetical protein
MFSKSQRQGLMGVVAALVVAVIVLQARIDPLRRQEAIEPKTVGKVLEKNATTLPFEYILGTLTGFRQVIAGLLWVRTDSFFHSGNYDAVLPMIRLITWLDPNWLDVYATGAWHLMYNFTDTDQRSDRRYLEPGLALLDEGIANNPNVYDLYKEKGWNNFDKVKDYETAVNALKAGAENDPKFDVTQLGHLMAHALERAGRTDESIQQWEQIVKQHQAVLDDKKSTPDAIGRATQGVKSARNNLAHMKVRQIVRRKDTQPPVDAGFTVTVKRTKPKVLEISGTFNLVGAKEFDMGTPEKPGKGILVEGPVDGARVDVRLQDEGYKMAKRQEFSFEVDPKLTIMQDQISIRGGKKAEKGGLFVAQGKNAGSVERSAEHVAVYGFDDEEIKKHKLGSVLLSKGLGQLSPMGQLQAVSVAYPLPYASTKKQYTPAEVQTLMARLRNDSAKLAELDGKKYCVAQNDAYQAGTFRREIDMSKDPSMYSFANDTFELILTMNPRTAPDFVQDRIGWSGEGLTDKNYLYVDKEKNNLRMIRRVIKLKREDLTGTEPKVLVAK